MVRVGKKIFMQMKPQDVRRKMRVLRDWGYCCIVCGGGFDSLECVTIEHLVPRSMGGARGLSNQAPSHHACNERRGTMSLLEAAKSVSRSLACMTPPDAGRWLNQPVPSRIVPDLAHLPPIEIDRLGLCPPAAWRQQHR